MTVNDQKGQVENELKWSCIEERYNTGLGFGSVVRKEWFINNVNYKLYFPLLYFICFTAHVRLG